MSAGGSPGRWWRISRTCADRRATRDPRSLRRLTDPGDATYIWPENRTPHAALTVESSGPAEPSRITQLLADCSAGEGDAFARLIPLVYDDLRGIAHRRLAQERDDHTLGTTALVHEAYLRLVDQATATWQDRAHFFAVAARVIRHVLVDYARAKGAQKRGGDALRIPLREDLDGETPSNTIELLTLETALEELGRHDRRLEQLVECRFFGGMTMKDTAEALGVSLRTAERDWTRAKAYLYRSLR